MFDTLYIEPNDYGQPLLRTHTSPMWVRAMEEAAPPLYVTMPGRAYRRDVADPTHLAGFHQIDGLAVDKGISFADLKGSVEVFAKALFGPRQRIRMIPHYFPFTEPSAEVYVSCFNCDGNGCRICGGEGWIEIMGAGMVHPNVFKAVGYDPDVTGFAFGMGIERIALLRWSIGDIRWLVVKQDLQDEDEQLETDRDRLIEVLENEYEQVESLKNYDIYRRIDPLKKAEEDQDSEPER